MKKLSYALITSLMLVGCGSSGGSDNNIANTTNNVSNTTNTKSVQVVDGYITNATVCIDKNNNYVCDEGDENITKTDNNGSYTYDIKYDQYNQLIIGGEDNVTKTENTDILIKSADLNTTIINPFTTLVANYVKSGMDIDEAKSKVANVLGIQEDDIIKNPLENIELAKKVSELNLIKLLTKSSLADLAKENVADINDLCDNNQTIIDQINKIESNNTATPEELEKSISNIVSEINQNVTEDNIKVNVNSIKEIHFDGVNPSYVELNLTKGNYIFTAESANKIPYTINIISNNIEANDEKIYDDNGKLISKDVNITGIDAKDVAPSMSIEVDANSTLKIPLEVYNQQDSLIEANITTSIIKSGDRLEYSHEINITDVVKNSFLYKNQVDEYYTFDINDTTAGNYDLNVFGVNPNPLGEFAVKLTDGTKTLIDNDIEDDFNYTRSVTLESGKKYTLTISITNSKLPAVRSDYIGNYEIKFIKK